MDRARDTLRSVWRELQDAAAVPAVHRALRLIHDELTTHPDDDQLDLFGGASAEASSSAAEEPVGASPFQAGMDASAASARTTWTEEEVEAVDGAIQSLARSTRPTFTADDVWRVLKAEDPAFPVCKGLASRLLVAARRGLIHNTGEKTVAKRGGKHDHAQTLSVWAPGPEPEGERDG